MARVMPVSSAVLRLQRLRAEEEARRHLRLVVRDAGELPFFSELQVYHRPE